MPAAVRRGSPDQLSDQGLGCSRPPSGLHQVTDSSPEKWGTGADFPGLGRTAPTARASESNTGSGRFSRSAELSEVSPASDSRDVSLYFCSAFAVNDNSLPNPPGSPAWTKWPRNGAGVRHGAGLAPAPDLRVFSLVTVELSGFATRQETSGGPRCPRWRLRGCRRRRWRRRTACYFMISGQVPATTGSILAALHPGSIHRSNSVQPRVISSGTPSRHIKCGCANFSLDCPTPREIFSVCEILPF